VASGSSTAGPTRLDYVVREADAGKRLDVVLGQLEAIGSRSRAAALISAGAVTLDGTNVAKSRALTPGETVRATLSGEAPPVQAIEVAVPVVYEDEWLLVVDKPAGMPVHPSRGHSSGTLVQALSGYGLAGGDVFRPGVVHRLDKDTSGLLVVARTLEAHRRLAGMIRRRAAERRYLALVHGGFSGGSGTIEAPVGRDPVRRTSMTVGGLAAREATTHFIVLERFRETTLVEVRLETGRTHQIRVHFAAIGHQVVGDPLYARRDPLGVGRQFLHSHRLAFLHPVTGQDLSFESPLPDDLAVVLTRLRHEKGPRDD
jgi:23S rRNA pseudouridine1911/1915/1917 synthase